MNKSIENHNISLSPTLKITYTAIFSAFSVLANVFTLTLGNTGFQFDFLYFIYFISGIYLGPLCGGCVGLLGDLLGCLIAPKGPYIPFLTIGSMMLGVIPGLVFKYLKTNDLTRLIIAIVSGFVICSCFLNTFGLWFTYHYQPFIDGEKETLAKTFWIYLWGRMPVQAVNTTINGILIFALIKSKLLDKLMIKSANSISN